MIYLTDSLQTGKFPQSSPGVFKVKNTQTTIQAGGHLLVKHPTNIKCTEETNPKNVPTVTRSNRDAWHVYTNLFYVAINLFV